MSSPFDILFLFVLFVVCSIEFVGFLQSVPSSQIHLWSQRCLQFFLVSQETQGIFETLQ